jgi:DNA-binding response OmpR family regulator
MESPRIHPASDPGDPAGGGRAPGSPGPAQTGGRLNLLLSYAGWQPDSWVERLPVLLEPMGIHSLRATTGKQASQVIQQAPIHIAVVDLGLPLDETSAGPSHEEAGPRLLELLARLSQPPPTVVVKRSRTHRDDSREMAAALRAGAFAVIDRPRDSRDLELLLEVLRRCLHRHYQGRWPRLG